MATYQNFLHGRAWSGGQDCRHKSIILSQRRDCRALLVSLIRTWQVGGQRDLPAILLTSQKFCFKSHYAQPKV
jgi:hypothetical protein